MRLLKAFFSAIQSAANSVVEAAEIVVETIKETTKRVAITVAKVFAKTMKNALQMSMILAVGGATMLILPMILPMILTNTSNIEQEHSQAIELLPPSKAKPIKQVETIENEVLITPISDENLLIQSFFKTSLEQPTTEIQEASETDKTSTKRDIKPLSNQLATQMIGWQAINNVSNLLNKIKASELKSIASELHIPKYRNMNKTQLLLAITEAFDNAPAFSQ